MCLVYQKLRSSLLNPYSVGTALGDFGKVVEEYYSQRFSDGRKRIALDLGERSLRSARKQQNNARSNTCPGQTPQCHGCPQALRKRKTSLFVQLSADGDAQLTLDDLFKQTAKGDARQETRRNKDEIQRILDEMLGDQSGRFLTAQRLIREYADSDNLALSQFAEGAARIAVAAHGLL